MPAPKSVKLQIRRTLRWHTGTRADFYLDDHLPAGAVATESHLYVGTCTAAGTGGADDLRTQDARQEWLRGLLRH
jgi:hypothetical protein